MARCHVLLVSIGKLEWHLSRCDTTLRVVCAICLRLRMLPTQWGASCCMNEVCTKHIVYSCAWPTVRDWEASETERTTPYKLLVAHRLQLWSESTWLTIQTWSTFAECSSRFTRSKNPLRLQCKSLYRGIRRGHKQLSVYRVSQETLQLLTIVIVTVDQT